MKKNIVNELKKNLLLLAGTCLLMGSIFEMALRFFPVNESLLIMPVDVQHDVFHATPNRTIQFSKEWDFRFANKKRINNHGFVNHQDYVYESKKPLVSVVGDSYIESLHIPDGKAYYELIARDKPNLRYYSFGFSGAPLSEYLIWAKHAAEKYHTKYLIINVVGNDFDESLGKYQVKTGFYHYAEDSKGNLSLQLTNYRMGRMAHMLVHSALARYVVSNMQILHLREKIRNFLPSLHKPQYAGNVLANVGDQREKDSYKAIDAFYRDLPRMTKLSPENILIVVDVLREKVYNQQEADSANEENSYFGKMRQYLIQKGRRKGYGILDLQKHFEEDFRKRHQHYEFENDGHWNQLGHQVVAQAIEKTDWWSKLQA